MADVLVLLSSARAVERVRRAVQMDRACGVFHTLHSPGSWRELFDHAARSSLGTAFVDPYFSGSFALAEIERLRNRFPYLELVAYGDFTRRPAGDPFALGLLGVRAVLSLDMGDDPPVIRQCLADHLNWAPFADLLCRLREVVPAPVLGWLELALRSATVPRTVVEFAELVQCSPRTLRRTLRAAHLPSAEQVLAWRRLLHAVRLMEDTDRSTESVARALDYSSGSALRRSLKRATGLRPREAIRQGGLRLLMELFLRECRSPGEAPRVGSQ